MSTNCTIARLTNDNALEGTNCKFDGYPAGVGAEILRYFDSAEGAAEILSHPDIRCIEGGEVEYYRPACCEMVRWKDADELIAWCRKNGIGYAYLYMEDGWLVCEVHEDETDWVPIDRLI